VLAHWRRLRWHGFSVLCAAPAAEPALLPAFTLS
jgi:hypothetical protein